MSRVALRDGQTVEVPDGLNTKGGKQDWLIQQGFTPKQVGLETVETETAGGVEDFFIGMGEFLADRGIGQQSDIRAPSGVGSFVGRSALPVAAGTLAALATGGTGLGLVGGTLGRAGVQAGTAAGIEAVREGSTPKSVAGSAALAGGGSFGGDFLGRVANKPLSRVLTGIGNKVKGIRPKPQPVTLGPGVKGTPLQTIAQTMRGAGAFNTAVKKNIGVINDRIGRVFGLSDDVIRNIDDIGGDDFITLARDQVDDTYRAAQPGEAFKTGPALEKLEALKASGVPSAELDDVIKILKSADELPAETFQGIHATVRNVRAETSQNLLFKGMAKRADEAIDALDDAATTAGGDPTLMRTANERFKLLATIEETNSALKGGQITAGELLTKFKRTTRKGLGTRALFEDTGKLSEPMKDLVKVARDIARFESETAGGSATAGRLIAVKPLAEGAKGLFAGDVPAVAKGALSLAAPSLVGRAAVGQPGPAILGPLLGQSLAVESDAE